jgi:hypothetical protein
MAARWRAWGRYLGTAIVGASITYVAFGASRPVPMLDWFDLGVHEVAHLLAMPLPDMAMFMAGSVAQVAFPVAMAVYFNAARGDRAAAGFCMAWAGTSAWDVSVYIADAPVQALPLVGGGTHDWATLLGPEGFDAMARSGTVSSSVKWAGLGLAVAGVLVSLWPALRYAAGPRLRWARRPSLQPATPTLSDPAGDPWLAGAILPTGELVDGSVPVLNRRRSR